MTHAYSQQVMINIRLGLRHADKNNAKHTPFCLTYRYFPKPSVYRHGYRYKQYQFRFLFYALCSVQNLMNITLNIQLG